MFFNVVFWVDKFVVYYVLLCIVIMILGEDELFDIVELFEQLCGVSWIKVIGVGFIVVVLFVLDYWCGIMFVDVLWCGNWINWIWYFLV